MNESLTVRPAAASDADNILALIEEYAKKQLLLGRTREDLMAKLANFSVGEVNGEFVGCVALRDFGDGLFEVRSLAIRAGWDHRGIGSRLVASAAADLRLRGRPARLFALTRRAHLFRRLGFRIVEKKLFPQKIWSDCVLCPKKDHCDETAVLLEINP